MKIEHVNGELILDKQAKKAIRFCCGLNTDLRVNLDTVQIRRMVDSFLQGTGLRFLPISCDFSDEEQIDKYFLQIRKQVLNNER